MKYSIEILELSQLIDYPLNYFSLRVIKKILTHENNIIPRLILYIYGDSSILAIFYESKRQWRWPKYRSQVSTNQTSDNKEYIQKNKGVKKNEIIQKNKQMNNQALNMMWRIYTAML